METKTKYILVSVLLITLIITGVIIFNNNNAEIKFNDISGMVFGVNDFAEVSLNLKEFQTEDIYRESNDLFSKDEKFKSYNVLQKTLLIEDNKYETLIELKLLTNYKQHVGVGNDIIVAKMLLINFTNSNNNLFEKMDSYDIKDNYKSELKIFTLKYRTDFIEQIPYWHEYYNNDSKSIVNEIFYYNVSRTNWIEFTSLNELPNKNIEIGIFTDTIFGEEVEWVPTIEGFEVLEWASYLADGLLIYYKLDEEDTSANESIIDSTGNNNATNNGAANVTGQIKSALDFEYTEVDTLTSNSSTGISGANSWTMNSWIKIESQHSAGQPNAIMTLGVVGTQGNVASIQVQEDSFIDDLKWVSWGPSPCEDENIASGVTLIGNWHMVTATYDGTNCRLYVDGNNIYNNTGTYSIVDSAFRIGHSGSPGQGFDGIIDEVGLWNIALGTDGISDLYKSGVGLSYPFFELSSTLISPKDNFLNGDLGNMDFICAAESNASISNVTFYSNVTGSFIANGTNSSGIFGNYSFTRDVQSFDDFIWNCEVCSNESVCVFSENNFTIDMVNFSLQITDPITANPNNVSSSDNISINFNFQSDGVNLTSGVTMNNVTIGGSYSTILIDAGIPLVTSAINYEDFEGQAELYEGDYTYWFQADFDTTGEAWGAYTGDGQSAGTGPTVDYDGYYAMVETSSGQCNDPDTAVMYNSPEINFDSYSSVNISFAYHMYGSTMGTLHIKENSTGSWISVWSASGNLGDTWFTQNQNISGLTGNGSLAVWLDCGASFESDAAVDSINVTGTTGRLPSQEFAYIVGTGWQVNVTVPTFATGLKDLFLNSTYSGNVRNDTQINAIDYGGATLNITDPTTASPKSVNSNDNISINFNFQENGVNLTSGVTMDNVTIGGTLSTIISNPSTPSTSVSSYYDYNTGAGTSNVITEGESTFPPAWGIEGSEIASYTNVLTDNSQYYQITDFGSNFEGFVKMNFTISETFADVDWMYWELAVLSSYGGGEDADCYIGNFNTPGWEKICDMPTSKGSCNTNITSNVANYIDANGQILAVCAGQSLDAAGDISIDYVNLTVHTLTAEIPEAQQFAYITGTGWQVNVTVPTFTNGLKDLFLNATYSGNVTNDTQTNAINYGGGDATNPTWSLNQTNNTIAGASTLFSLYWNDDTALHPGGQYIFSTNNTGVWVNESIANFTATPQWTNTSKILNTTAGTSVGYRWFVDDNAGNINNTITFSLTTTASDTCTYTSGDWNVNCADNCAISSPVDVGGNNIFITGTGTFSTSSDITNYGLINIKGTDSSNICRVTCIGGCFKT